MVKVSKETPANPPTLMEIIRNFEAMTKDVQKNHAT